MQYLVQIDSKLWCTYFLKQFRTYANFSNPKNDPENLKRPLCEKPVREWATYNPSKPECSKNVQNQKSLLFMTKCGSFSGPFTFN